MSARAITRPVLRPVCRAVTESLFEPETEVTEWDPDSLFANGEPGALYDPTDLSSMFQEHSGNTPVTGVEQPVGLILDRRPHLPGLGPELRGNFVVGMSGGDMFPATYDPGTGEGTAHRTTTGIQSFVHLGGVELGKTYVITVENTHESSTLAVRTNNGSNGYLLLGPGESGTGYVYTVGTEGHTGILRIQGQNDDTHISFTIVSCKELPGNHAAQATQSARPMLSARHNYLPCTDPTDTTWTLTGGTIAADSDGFYAFEEDTSDGQHNFYANTGGTNVPPPDSVITLSIVVKNDPAGVRAFRFATNAAAPWSGAEPYVVVDLDLMTVTGLNNATGTIEDLGDDAYRVTCTTPPTTTQSGIPRMAIRCLSPAGTVTYEGQGRKLYVKEPQLEGGAAFTKYQWVAADGTYDTDGFPLYLKFDAVDDTLIIPTLDMSAVGAVTVWAGVFFQTANFAEVCGLSADPVNGTGVFGLVAPTNDPALGHAICMRLRGTAGALQAGTPKRPYQSYLATFTGSIAENRRLLRVDGVIEIISNASLGTANLASAPLYIGSRGSTTTRYNGRLYFLGIRGAFTSVAVLDLLEQSLKPRLETS